MNWKEELIQYENTEQWHKAIDLMEDIIKTYPNDVEVYVRYIYLLHYILLESTDPELSFSNPRVEGMLIKYFNEGNKKFADNAEYLFFIGRITRIAQWYFELNDEDGPIEDQLSFKMQMKSVELESSNILYIWSWFYSYYDSNPLTELLKNEILRNDVYVKWLESKGFPGDYVLNVHLRAK